MTKKRFLFILVFIIAGDLWGYTDKVSTVIRNLEGEWQYYTTEGYLPFTQQHVKAIYFRIDANKYKGDFLVIEDEEPFSVFVDGKLIVEKSMGKCKLSLDTLAKLYSSKLFFGIYQRKEIDKLSTTIQAPLLVLPPVENAVREGNYFLNFSILASLILLTYFISLLRANPKLTLDYLNITKIFSIQEREDDLLNSRVTASVNLLFYLLGSLFIAFILLIIFHFGESLISVARHFKIDSLGEGFLQWIKLTMIISTLLILKLLLVYFISFVFHLKETPSVHFFNYIRVLLLTFSLLAIGCAFYFMIHGQHPAFYFRLLWMSVIIFILGDLMIYFKLLVKATFHGFHLFSYLCITEIIPLVILIRILLY